MIDNRLIIISLVLISFAVIGFNTRIDATNGQIISTIVGGLLGVLLRDKGQTNAGTGIQSTNTFVEAQEPKK